MQVQSNVNFQPGREHKVIHPKCKSKAKVPIGMASKVKAEKLDPKNEPSEIIEFAVQKPHKRPFKFGQDTIVIPTDLIEMNQEVFAMGTTILIHKGEIILSPDSYEQQVDTIIVSAELRKDFAEIVYIGKAPEMKVAVAILSIVEMGDKQDFEITTCKDAKSLSLILGRRDDDTLFAIEDVVVTA